MADCLNFAEDEGDRIIHGMTQDPIFDYVLHKAGPRNTFLSRMLRRKVLSSEITSRYLYPFDDYLEFRKAFDEASNTDGLKILANLVKSHGEEQGKKTLAAIKKLLALTDDLIPEKSRRTVLDIVCHTESGIVNIELQFCSQFIWEIRLLAQACGLMGRQARKGLKWDCVDPEGYVVIKGKKEPAFKETIAIGILINAPITRPVATITAMPWMDLTPWRKGEVERIFRLRCDSDPNIVMPGLTIISYVLSQLPEDIEGSALSAEDKALYRLLEAIARNEGKTMREVEHYKETDPALFEVYETLSDVPQYVMEKAREEKRIDTLTKEQAAMQRILGREEGIEQGREEGIEKGREIEALKIASVLLEKGLEISIISQSAGVPIEKLQQILGTVRH